MLKRMGLAIGVVFLAVGCSSIKVIQNPGPKDEGLRFYRPWPYLLVEQDEKGGVKPSIIYLPKMDEAYAIQVKSRLGKVDAKFSLDDGWKLKEYDDSRDTEIPQLISAVTGSIKDLATTATTLAQKAAAPGTKAMEAVPAKPFPLPPGLYAFTFEDGKVTGVQPLIK
jgi:hypothetical protein